MRTLRISSTSLVIALALSAGSASAQAAPGSALDFLVGTWEGEGLLFGQPASFHMTWTRTAGESLYQLEFRNALGTGADAQTVLEAEAMYRWSQAEGWSGTWFDSREKRLELEGTVIQFGSAFRVEWTDPGVEEGVTIYRGIEGGMVEVIDSVAGSEGMRLFGSAKYRRSGGN